MRYSILFIIVLVMVSGFIAYFGDVLGRWMGKKRLTLLSLRPRHTAYMVTAVTGMLISALVLAALVSVNTQFRKGLTEGDLILAQNKSLSKSNVRLGVDNKALENRRRQLEARVVEQKKEVDEAQEAAIKAAEAQVKAAQNVARLEKDIAARKREIDARKRELASLHRTSAMMKQELTSVQGRLAKAQGRLSRAQENWNAAVNRLAGTQAKLLETNKNLDTAQTQLQQAENAIKQQETVLREQQASLVRVGNEKLEVERQADLFRNQTLELRNRELTLRQGDEITRGVISPKQSEFGIRADVFSLLQAASDKAAKLGASVAANGRAVFIDNESAWVKTAVGEIGRSAITGYDTLVQVVCSRNCLQGEQVPVRLVLYANKVVYRKGDLIAGAKLDGRTSEGRVLLSVIDFLQKTVSINGLNAGVVPIANPDSRANSATNPRSQVEGLMTVVDQITSKKARVNVEAYACADIYAEGPLNMNNMRFSVTKIER